MKKQQPLTIILIIAFFLLSSFVWGQEYQLRKTIGFPISHINSIVVETEEILYVAHNHSVSKITVKGEILLHFGSKGTEDGQFDGISSIVLDAQGNIYVADGRNDRIQKFDPTGRFLFKFGSRGLASGQFRSPTSIALDVHGNIYVADKDNYRIQKFDPTGKFLTKISTYGTANGQVDRPTGVALDVQGNIYVADTYNSRIQKFDATGKFVAKFGSNGVDDGKLYHPTAITLDVQGNSYVLDKGNDRIQKFDSEGKFVLKISSDSIDNEQFDNLQGVTLDNKGNIYVVNFWKASYIQKFDPTGKFLFKLPSSDSEDRQFYHSKGVAFDKQGNSYVVDNENHRIQKFDSQGNFLFKFGSKGHADGQFYHPSGIALDIQGNIYVVDRENDRIQKFDATGKFLLKFGSSGQANGQFWYPTAIALDKQGNIYVADWGNHRIQKFDPTGKFLFKSGVLGYLDGHFHYPTGIKLNSHGDVYVIDDSRIQMFSSTGKFLSKFNLPASIHSYYADFAMDTWGNFYVVDSPNSRICKLSPNGKLLSKIGLTLVYSNIAIDHNNTLYATAGNGLLIYESTRSWGRISGRIFADDNQNCILDNNEKALSNVVVMTKPGNYYGLTDEAGKYEIVVDTGTYTVSQVLIGVGQMLQPVCPVNNISSPVVLKMKGDSATNINFANIQTLLPHLSSSVSSNRRRRCFLSTTTVNYANTGYGDAQNVKVYVKLPKYVALKSADKSYTLDKDSIYVFTIGTLKVGETGQIQIKDSIVCQRGITGLTVCTKAWITPANSVTPKSTWDQSDITLSGRCIENGRVRFVLTNSGQGNMADSSEFRLLLDAKLALRKNFKLAKGDSLVLRVPANGKTVRLEVNQRPDHPRKAQSSLTLEGCVASASEEVSKGLVNVLPQDDAEAEVSVECLPIIDSFDPNDKQVSPIGTTTEHFTPTTASLKYLIRFQNTGSDTAYTVVVVDTLSEHLDMATLEVQGSSHPYKLGVSGKGRPVLSFTFNNINLPDSTRNQLASNGFIQFSITPKAGLAEKTLIENFADIFFDYNDPIRTNTTTNRIYDVPLVVDNTVHLDEKKVIILPPTISSFAPESVSEGMQVVVTGTRYESVAKDNSVTINGLSATVVSASETQLTIIVPQGVKSGKITVTTGGGMATSQKSLLLRPLISSFSPASVLEGESLTITGKYYELLPANNTVQINGLSATVLSATETQLVVQVPQGAKRGKISVTTPGGTVSSEQILLFRPTISNFTPETASQGTEMTITGTHYEPVAKDNVVKINGVLATVVSATETQLVVTVPAGVTTGKISVTTPGGTTVSEVDFVQIPLATEPAWSRPIRIYPNPVEGMLRVDFSAAAVSVQTVEVVNMIGQTIMSKTVSKRTRTEELNLSGVASGMYLLVLKTTEGTAVRKIQVK